MIGLMLLKKWFSYLVITVAALIAEWRLITSPVWFTVFVTVTLAVFAVITALLWDSWRAYRRGSVDYHYQIIHYTRD